MGIRIVYQAQTVTNRLDLYVRQHCPAVIVPRHLKWVCAIVQEQAAMISIGTRQRRHVLALVHALVVRVHLVYISVKPLVHNNM